MNGLKLKWVVCLVVLHYVVLLNACATNKTVNIKERVPLCADSDRYETPNFEDSRYTKYFRVKSKLLSEFWKQDVFIEAGVVLPKGYTKEEKLPVCYDIHGFGGNHWKAWRHEKYITASNYPRMIYVYPNAMFKNRHHVFANSVNNGPWADAFVKDFIPAIEDEYGAYGKSEGRFLTGHSSGGWSSLWLQISYLDYFGGTWAKAPDPVDFRDFSGIDLYSSKSVFTNPDGSQNQLIRHDENWIMSFADYVRREYSKCPKKGQMDSFDYAFSPKGADGNPIALFDRASGLINQMALDSWKKYDISLVLRENWKEYQSKLRGKLHIFIGEWDQFRLESSVALLKKELGELDSDAVVLIVPERGHLKLSFPHQNYWPQGLYTKIHMEMLEQFEEYRESI